MPDGRSHLGRYGEAVLFDVRTLTRDGWTVVAVVGDVDLATIPSLNSKLAVADERNVALDLSGVDLFDALGTGVLVAAARRAHRADSDFAIVCPPGRPRDLLAETRLDEILTVVDGFEDLAAVSA